MANLLIIGKNKVTIETDIVYKALEFNYYGKLNIKSLLPNDYLVKKGRNKLIILKFNTGEDIPELLFEYFGACIIVYGYLLDKDYKRHKLEINRTSITTWNRFGMTVKQDGTHTTQTWEGLTTDYKLLAGSIRNDGYERTKYVDDGTGTNTKMQKKVIEYRNTYKKDRNLSILGNQYTDGRNYRIKGKNTPYTGKYHIHLNTLKVMTGEMPEETSRELIQITFKKTKGIVSKTIRRGY